MDLKLLDAIEEFVTRRMDDLGTDAPEAVTEAITQVGNCMTRLTETLSEEQMSIVQGLEDALSLQTGEETRYYYQAGLNDAVRFLLGWSGAD